VTPCPGQPRPWFDIRVSSGCCRDACRIVAVARIIVEPVVFRERVSCARVAFGVCALGIEAVFGEETVGRFEVSRRVERSRVERSRVERSRVERSRVEGTPCMRIGSLLLEQPAFRQGMFRQSVEANPLHRPRGPRCGSFGRVFGLGHARMYSSVVVRR
jgi:hypothetical protein